MLQVQGPTSLQVLSAAADAGMPEPFAYFGVVEIDLGGQPVIVSRTGWTAERGFEVYTRGAQTDALALWSHLMVCGAEFGLGYSGLESMGIRRIEAGILDNGTDMNPTLTPYAAGLGAFVNLEQSDFIGRDALRIALRDVRLLGITCAQAAPERGAAVFAGEREVGVITTGVWSPELDCGIGYVRLACVYREQALQVASGPTTLPVAVTGLPFYDKQKRLPCD